jgi:MFS transporter, DHA3 family, macrolide efflux protein
MQTTSEQNSIPKNWARRFFIIWTGQSFSLVGSALVQFALIWYLTRTTGSATVLAVASLIGILQQFSWRLLPGHGLIDGIAGSP